MNLVVVESPSKSKTIKKYLGKDYHVIASKGHVVDLPKSTTGIDPENNFKADYVVTKKEALADIKRAFKGADKLIIASDLDREGEAIGWHIAKELGVIDEKGKHKGKRPLERIVFHEITKEAIEDAIAHPRDINMDLVNAQQARRFLDRLVGYKLSPLLWKKITFGLSAGRVQSAALRLVVEKEEEREAFKKDEYWTVEAFADHKDTKPKYVVNYKLTDKDAEEEPLKVPEDLIQFDLFKISNKKPELTVQKEAEKVIEDVKDEKWVISNIERAKSKRNPRPPFITSTLQQAGVNVLGYSSKRTMSIAQKLYEAGFITYMRTDSVSMSAPAVAEAVKYIKKNLGDNYLPEKVTAYASSNKSAQEAHECIRPTSFFKKAQDLGLEGEQAALYNLIWAKALSSLMVAAEFLGLSMYVEIGKYTFKANGKTVIFDGYLKVMKEKLNETILPEMNIGDKLGQKEFDGIQHFTQPPARYSEATLIKKLEELGIGRPSTYASIISTLLARKYAESENKYLKPTDTGRVVNSLLVKYFEQIVNYGFTAGIEDDLDKVAEGKLDWIKFLGDFYFPFEKEVAKQDKNIPRKEFTELGKSDEKCPVCGKPMIIKLGRYGKFLSCTDYPKCKGMKSLETEVNGQVMKEIDFSRYDPAPKTKEGVDYVIKTGRFGSFWAHPDYPKVKDAQPLTPKRDLLIEMYGEIPQTKDKRDYLLKKGKFGFFWAHPDYPKEKDIIRIKKPKKAKEE
ncbi:MAG: type I DNA topoisomerase [Candidatus Dojkabacteria bacterium]